MNKNNKGGRPNKAFSEKRKYQINVKVNIEEQVFLKKQIRDSGLSCNDFIRECIRKSVIKQRITTDEIIIIKQLISMANSINKIENIAISNGFNSAKKEYISITNEMDKLIKQLLK